MSSVTVKVSGDFALYTRPEGKVERVTYSVMTPSAARGILESIFWKPEFNYCVRKIKVLKTPQYHSIMRNEIESKASINTAFMKNPKDVFVDDMRQLRHSLILKDVSYIIEADIILQNHTKDPIEKYKAIFNRRVTKGQCYYRPYLGTREFSAHFEQPDGTEKPIDWTDALGTMLYDFRYPEKGSAIPYFFNARIENGVLDIPNYLYEEVNR